MDDITKEILDLFEVLNRVPRCSKKEGEISNWLKEQALAEGLSFRRDAVNNVLIRVAASPGYESSPVLVLQGHMDMVCERSPISSHDFTRDPIEHIIEGDWLRANGTTLGADNGIAIALSLVLARHREIQHPPLELLFTVDEETGLTGANALMPDFISGRMLLNLDSEEEGTFINGCAGGMTTNISLPLEYTRPPSAYNAYQLRVTGLAGGHSGVDIHEKRANANKLLAQVLRCLMDRTSVLLVAIKGGSAHNAIPRDAEALLALASEEYENAVKLVRQIEEDARKEFNEHERTLSIQITSSPDGITHALSHEAGAGIVSLLERLPHGVISRAEDGSVISSSNLAMIRTMDAGSMDTAMEGVARPQELRVVTNQRSSDISELHASTERVVAIANCAGAKASHEGSYPPWQPEPSSPLLKQCKDIYTKTFGKEPALKVIHAGLECAVIASRFPGMDMVSCGPTIKNPHSPDERLYIPSIIRVWDFLVMLLASLK